MVGDPEAIHFDGLSATRTYASQGSENRFLDSVRLAAIPAVRARYLQRCMSRRSSMDDQMPFQTYTVAESTQPVTLGAIKIIPDYTFADAPMLKIVVIPAQAGQTEAMLNWIRKATKTADVTMSVCTRAFVLASTGLLAGKPATTTGEMALMAKYAG